jgi:hypothetical protein
MGKLPQVGNTANFTSKQHHIVSGVPQINEFDNELLLDQDETIILNKSIRSA